MASRLRHPLWEMTWARVLEFLRDPAALFWVFGFPIILALALGMAFRERPPEPHRVMAVGEGKIDALARVKSYEGIDLIRGTPSEAAAALRKDRIDAVLAWDSNGKPVIRYDSAKPQGRAARMALLYALSPERARAGDAPVHQQGSRYIDFLLPGLIGLNLMGSGMWGVGYAVVDMRRRKLLKRYAATPMRRSHFLLAMMLSRVVFLMLELGALLAFGRLVFGVQVIGSPIAVVALALLGSLSFTGIALLAASRTDSTEVGAGLINMVMLPMWLLSGAFFSYTRFPDWLHPFCQALPLTAINDALRAVINDGDSLLATAPQTVVLAAWGLIAFILALRWFRWQ